MSNPTIELGGGKWATKPTSLLAYNNHPEWGYNAKEFTVARNSTATCVGSDGLIKTVQANEARIDYSNDPNGALLVEPQRTNLFTYSIVDTGWNRAYSVTITANYGTAPDGTQTSSHLTWDNVNYSDGGTISQTLNITKANTTYTMSFWAKGSGTVEGRMWHNSGGGGTKVHTLTSEWQRFETTITTTETAPTSSSCEIKNYTDVEIWGAQLEESSTASSLIPTNGTTVTRLKDYLENVDLEREITQGVLFFDWTITNSGNRNWLSNNIASTGVYLQVIGEVDSETFIFQTLLRNDNTFNRISDALPFPARNKVAILFTDSLAKTFVNGELVGETTVETPFTVNTLTHLLLDDGGEKGAKYEAIKIFDSAMNDQELIDLTTI